MTLPLIAVRRLAASRAGSRSLRRAAAALALALALGCGTASMEEVRALQDAGAYAESIEMLRDILAQEPESAEASYRLGLALLRTGRPGQALWPLKKAADSDEFGAAVASLGVKSASRIPLSTRSWRTSGARCSLAVPGPTCRQALPERHRDEHRQEHGQPDEGLVRRLCVERLIALALRPEDTVERILTQEVEVGLPGPMARRPAAVTGEVSGIPEVIRNQLDARVEWLITLAAMVVRPDGGLHHPGDDG